MFRRLASNYRKYALIFFVLLLIFIFVNREDHGSVKKDEDVLEKSALAVPTVPTLPTIVNATANAKLKRKTLQPRRFFVFSKKCKMPYADPFAPDVMSIYDPPTYKACRSEQEPDLVSVRYDAEKRLYSLHVNEENLDQLMENVSSFTCNYRETFRGRNDSHSVLGAAVYFRQDMPVPRHILGMIVECHLTHNISQVIQRDAFSFVQYPSDRLERHDSERLHYPSVIILGIDSMSRMNFRRTMRLTDKFVRQPGWFEMEGYNKVGDNTLPNLLVLLTGRTPRQTRSICNVQQPGCFDQLSYLWNHFKSAGYLTALAEDLSGYDTFNYLNHGFLRQPVDFYLRPFMMVCEQIMDTVKHFGFKYCVGRRLSFSYIYDFCEQFVQRFVAETPKPVFGLFWTNSFTHDNYTGAATLDDKFVGYLRRFERLGLFERAIVVLLSDHGSRFGPLLELPDGFLEERLPMLHIYLPPWYRERHPKIVRALKLNRNRLSSTFDLHLALKHLLLQLRPQMEFNMKMNCDECRSLLRPLPRDRSCKDAGIAEHWCTCQPYAAVPVEGFMSYLVKLVVFRMNKYLRSKPEGKYCHRLYFVDLMMAERKLHFDDLGHEMKAPMGLDSYRFKFTTRPNNGVYRATILSSKDASMVDIPLSFISRLNAYKNESYCVQDRIAKKFCLCIQSELLHPTMKMDETVAKSPYEKSDSDFDYVEY